MKKNDLLLLVGSILLYSAFQQDRAIALSTHKQRNALEPVDVRRGDMASAAVVPLSLGVERVQLDPPACIRHGVV